MKFDTIIIGGGLTGLMCAISLQQRGVRCAVISAGQSALHFSSGSFDLLNYLPDGQRVDNPVEAVTRLAEDHPYRKLGKDFQTYADRAYHQLSDCGIHVSGESTSNHFRYTPMGTLKPTWLTLSEFGVVKSEEEVPQGRTLIANFAGFLDFNTKFIADALSKRGADCQTTILNVEAIDRLRKSPTEMRASNIARTLENEDTFNEFLSVLKKAAEGYDTVILPSVFGLRANGVKLRINAKIPVQVELLPTMPPSVPGIRTQMELRRAFEKLGGVYILGDTVRTAVVDGQQVKSIYTANHVDFPFTADHFVLATGHFFSGGLVAEMDSVKEPVFGCDVDYISDRAQWYKNNPFDNHPYFRFGVISDMDFKLKKNGEAFSNLYGAGSILSGACSMTEGSGAGVSMLTALRVADLIVEGSK